MEVTSKTLNIKEVVSVRRVHIYLQPRILTVTGQWQWTLQASELFCSNVFFSLAEAGVLPAAQCLIHPDDVAFVQKILLKITEGELPDFSFRVITSFGEVTSLSLNGIYTFEEDNNFTGQVLDKLSLKSLQQVQLRKENQHLTAEIQKYQLAEQVLQAGVWHINTCTHEVVYSDNLFRLYGLLPQSLNAHYHTFSQYIHPADRVIVTEAFDNAYRQQLPLHLEYRIIDVSGKEKHVRQVTQWLFNDKGELMLTGVLQNIARETEQENVKAELNDTLLLETELLLQTEKVAKAGTWYMNLLTRKITFSQNLYSLYGIKQQTVMPGLHALLAFVHPDDKNLMAEINRKILFENRVPEVDFRIIRGDGKLVYLRQTGKVIINSQKEMMIIGSVLDVSAQKMRERKLQVQDKAFQLQRWLQKHTEENSGTGSWMWDMGSGQLHWSPGLLRLLGLRASNLQLSLKSFLSFVHPEDQKAFSAQINHVQKNKEHVRFKCRLLQKGSAQYISVDLQFLVENDEQLLFCTLQDTTREFELEKELNEVRRFEELLYDAAQDRVWVTDTANSIIKWNRECEKAYGVKKDKAVGQNIFDVLPQLKTPETILLFLKALQGETVKLHHHDLLGDNQYCHVLMTPITDTNNNIIAVLSVLHDITREVQLQLELTGRMQFMEKLLETSVDRIMVLDQDMNYLFWNRRAEDYYGLKKEEVIGKNILEIFPHFLNDANYQKIRRALRGEIIHVPAMEALEERKGYFETYLIPVKNEQQKVDSVLWVVHDLTHEIKLQWQQ